MIKDIDLIDYLAGELSADKSEEIRKWIESSEENRKHFSNLKQLFAGHKQNNSEEFLAEDWAIIEERINKTSENAVKQGKSIAWWISRAAAIIVLALGTYMLTDLQNDDIIIRGKSAEPVASMLPDGSEVYLSRGSRLHYNKDFNSENRQVKIFGEAFFSVTTNKEKPFVVDTGSAKIKVTGTSFLVSASGKEDNVEVAVNSGNVLFYNSETYTENSFKVDLGPGDIGIYSQRLNQVNKKHDKEHKNSIWKQDES